MRVIHFGEGQTFSISSISDYCEPNTITVLLYQFIDSTHIQLEITLPSTMEVEQRLKTTKPSAKGQTIRHIGTVFATLYNETLLRLDYGSIDITLVQSQETNKATLFIDTSQTKYAILFGMEEQVSYQKYRYI